MRITKYPQSCLLVETQRGKILVDPGALEYKEEYFTAWNQADIVLLTHWNSDHVNYAVLKRIKAPIFSTLEVQNKYPDLKIEVISENDDIPLDYMSVYVAKAIRGYNSDLSKGKNVYENGGYIINGIIGGNNNKLYVTSDAICLKTNYKADIVALSVTRHGLMSGYDATLFAKDLGAKLVLPTYIDNDLYPTDLEYMKVNFEKNNVNYRILEIGESIEI